MKYTPEELSILKNLNAISEEEYQNKLNAIQPKTSSFNLDKVNSQIEEAKDSLNSLKEFNNRKIESEKAEYEKRLEYQKAEQLKLEEAIN